MVLINIDEAKLKIKNTDLTNREKMACLTALSSCNAIDPVHAVDGCKNCSAMIAGYGKHENTGVDYAILPCGNGDLGVRAKLINGGIVLFKDRHIASGYFDVNYCPICGRKLEKPE